MKYAIIKNNAIEKVIIANSMEEAILSATELYKLEPGELDISELIEEIYEESTIDRGQIIPPKPYNSWVLLNNEWVSPKPVPEDDTISWFWDEESLDWADYGKN